MKKLFPAILASLGIGAAPAATPEVKTVDPKTIRFTLPTVAADELQFVMPTKETFEGAPQFHEDVWCQLEFFPKQRLAEIKRLLAEYKSFERKNRTHYGWNEIYARRLARPVLIPGAGAVSSVAGLIGAKQLPSPILTTASRPLGQVKGGFSLRLPGSVLLYGLASEQGINALGAMVERGGEDIQLTKAFFTLSTSSELILVDWQSQMVLVSATASGAIDVWRP